MSDMEKVTDTEAMEAIQGFANACYKEGFKDAAIATGIGAGFVLVCAGTGVLVGFIKEKIKEKRNK